MGRTAGSNLITRTLSGVVLLVVVLASVLLSQYSFAALMMVICVGSLSEFNKIAEQSGARPLKGYSLTVGLAVVLLNFLVAKGSLPVVWLSCLIIPVVVPFIVELYRKSSNPLHNISATISGLVYVAMPMSLMMWIGLDLQTAEYMPWVVLSYIFIVWANDVGAFLVGVSIGKHKLFERISPKKSWEGFFGGLASAVIVGGIAASMMERSVIVWALLGAVVSVSGVFGDLVESMFKRSVNIKDSGAIMPGHGGFLDRFDALLISAPFVFVYFMIFSN